MQRTAASGRILRAGHGRAGGLTLVEMLVAMSITLVIMAAIVTVFANISGSVTRRRATIEMASALRNVREVLARDLAGATCPAVPWQRPESNHGYLEIVEGPQNDYYPSPWLWDSNDSDTAPDGFGGRAGIDLAISSLPGSNLRAPGQSADEEGRGRAVGSNDPLVEDGAPTDGRGLGDADDLLMLTVRNENEPFVGRIPKRFANDKRVEPSVGPVSDPASRTFPNWERQEDGLPAGDYNGGYDEVESPLAEVVWYAVENPTEPADARTYAFGEPGYRTIYRRALLILPDIDYGIVVDGVRADPGVVRVLPAVVDRSQVASALAALVAFQERYDLSVRLEWDLMLPRSGRGSPAPGRWVLKANTLADLTKRENRYEHHGFVPQPQAIWYQHGVAHPGNTPSNIAERFFPFAVASGGIHGGSGTFPVQFTPDPEVGAATAATQWTARTVPAPVASDSAASTVVDFNWNSGSGSRGSYAYRPLAFINDNRDRPGTARAILNEEGAVVHVTSGLAPLGGSRRGDDVMITDALGFDLRVFDPGAPTYAYYRNGVTNVAADRMVAPGDPAWPAAHYQDINGSGVGDGVPVPGAAAPFVYQGQGAYVDLGYGLSYIVPRTNPTLIPAGNRFAPIPLTNDAAGLWSLAVRAGRVATPFYFDGLMRSSTGPSAVQPDVLTRRYATYDTWSLHYESNGLNEDGDQPTGTVITAATEQPAIDEGTDGLDSPAVYFDDRDPTGAPDGRRDTFTNDTRNGPDDFAERETRPPYDAALRGLQVTLRVYERDSRQIREVKVRESFVPE